MLPKFIRNYYKHKPLSKKFQCALRKLWYISLDNSKRKKNGTAHNICQVENESEMCNTLVLISGYSFLLQNNQKTLTHNIFISTINPIMIRMQKINFFSFDVKKNDRKKQEIESMYRYTAQLTSNILKLKKSGKLRNMTNYVNCKFI